MATLRIVYFAWVRDAIGKDEETIDHPGGDITVEQLVALLRNRGGGYVEAFADTRRLRAALDQSFVPMTTAIGGASEVAIFPPVTGG